MNRKLTIALSLMILLGFSQVTQTIAQTRVPGVSQNDYFIYTITVIWSSTNIGATAPQDLLDINNTIYNCTIIDVLGSNITTTDVWNFNNDTGTTAIVEQNVDSGRSFVMNGLITIVGSNLGPNDLLFSSENDLRRINQTVSIDYGTVKRDANVVVLTYPGSGIETYYFDKATGVLVARGENSVDSGENVTSVITLANTNRWYISHYPSIGSPTPTPSIVDTVQIFGITMPISVLIAVVAVIILAAVVAPLVFYRTRKSRKKKHRR